MQTSDVAENESNTETGSHKRLTRDTCATRNARPVGPSCRTPGHWGSRPGTCCHSQALTGWYWCAAPVPWCFPRQECIGPQLEANMYRLYVKLSKSSLVFYLCNLTLSQDAAGITLQRFVNTSQCIKTRMTRRPDSFECLYI